MMWTGVTFNCHVHLLTYIRVCNVACSSNVDICIDKRLVISDIVIIHTLYIISKHATNLFTYAFIVQHT